MKIHCQSCGKNIVPNEGHSIRCKECDEIRLQIKINSVNDKQEALREIKRHSIGLLKAVEKLEKEI
jgi:hypothetical protein